MQLKERDWQPSSLQGRASGVINNGAVMDKSPPDKLPRQHQQGASRAQQVGLPLAFRPLTQDRPQLVCQTSLAPPQNVILCTILAKIQSYGRDSGFIYPHSQSLVN